MSKKDKILYSISIFLILSLIFAIAAINRELKILDMKSQKRFEGCVKNRHTVLYSPYKRNPFKLLSPIIKDLSNNVVEFCKCFYLSNADPNGLSIQCPTEEKVRLNKIESDFYSKLAKLEICRTNKRFLDILWKLK